MILCDSHCHLDLYPPEQLPEVLELAKVKQVGILVSMGTTLESSEKTIQIARNYSGVLAAVGIHPWNAVPPTDKICQRLYNLARDRHVVAIGEIGLDYIRSPETKEVQKELLIHELSIAREAGLPVNLHCKEAHQDMMHILRNETGYDIKGVIHGFSGDQTTLRDWLDLDFYISIGVRGIVDIKIPSLEEAIRHIPSNRLLIETDSAARDELDRPAELIYAAQKMASLRGTTVEDIANITTENLKRLQVKHGL